MSAQPTVIVDVWSRTAPKYRRRAALMLFLLFVMFAGLCCFTFWLRTGVFWPWESERYADLMHRSLTPAGPGQVTLADFLATPINVRDVPIHSVIMGLLFATLGSFPILVAILYRFPASVLLCAMVMFLAALPWLGLTILLGCALASVKPFRFTFRYASALLGLMPIGVYFIAASWQPGSAQARPVQQQALMYAPWVLALVSSCVVCALALAMAKLINYRPGGITPMLAVVFAIPVCLFFLQVGRDELEYRILVEEIQPGSSAMFAPRDIAAEAQLAATHEWSKSRTEPFERIHRRILAEKLVAARQQAEEDQADAVEECDWFIEHFKSSRYVANVLFLRGQAQDQRIDRTKFDIQHRLEFRCDVPSQASETTWDTIEQKFSDTDVSAMALYKLAILRARAGKIPQAIALLDRMTQTFDVNRATTQPIVSGRQSVFQRSRPSEGLGLDIPALVVQAYRLREMLDACRNDPALPLAQVLGPRPNDPAAKVQPIQLLLWLDDSDPHYQANLENIARLFPGSAAAGYVEVRRGLLEPAISRRIARFKKTAHDLASAPAGAEALYYLGDVLQDDTLLDEARAAFEDLVKHHPRSCWTAEAKDRLASLVLVEGTPS